MYLLNLTRTSVRVGIFFSEDLCVHYAQDILKSQFFHVGKMQVCSPLFAPFLKIFYQQKILEIFSQILMQ